MTEVKWIKLSVNMFNDEKIKLIRTMPEGDRIIVVWVQLLCLAGKTNDNGSIYMGQNIYYTDEMLATLCDQPLNIMRIAIKTLEQFGMVENNEDGLLQIVNWEKHQSTDKMARLRYQHRERQQKYYYRNKLRELGYKESELPDDLEELKKLAKKPDVSMTLPNATEVRSKKLEERSKKKDVRCKKEEVNNDDNDHQLTNEDDFPDLDPNISKITELYQQNIGVMSPIITEGLLHWYDDLGLDLVVEAIKRTAMRGANYKYLNKILLNWEKQGIATLDEVKAQDLSFEKQKNKKQRSYRNPKYKEESVPDWMKDQQEGKEFKSIAMDEEEKELRERLNGLMKRDDDIENY